MSLPPSLQKRWNEGGVRVASAILAAIARRELLFRGVLARLFLGHLAGQRSIARHERRHLLEAGPVPLLELHHPRAFMVFAARLDRGEESAGAELLDPRLGQVQMLETPANLFGCHHLALAVLR